MTSVRHRVDSLFDNGGCGEYPAAFERLHMIYKGKNRKYTVLGTDNCRWDDDLGRWVAPDPAASGSVVLERIADGKVFFLFYHCQTQRWVGRGIKDGKIDGDREVTL